MLPGYQVLEGDGAAANKVVCVERVWPAFKMLCWIQLYTEPVSVSVSRAPGGGTAPSSGFLALRVTLEFRLSVLGVSLGLGGLVGGVALVSPERALGGSRRQRSLGLMNERTLGFEKGGNLALFMARMGNGALFGAFFLSLLASSCENLLGVGPPSRASGIGALFGFFGLSSCENALIGALKIKISLG